MKGSDIFLVIITISIFSSLILLNNVTSAISSFKEQWPEIRCNPIAMPFASVFGFDTTSNFIDCVQGMQSKYMKHLLQPVNYNFGVMGSLSSSILDSLKGVREFINKIRVFINSIVGGVFGVFLNLLIEVQRLTLNIKDMISKLVGVMAVILFTLDGSIKTMKSIWLGPPGQLVRSL